MVVGKEGTDKEGREEEERKEEKREKVVAGILHTAFLDIHYCSCVDGIVYVPYLLCSAVSQPPSLIV